MFYQYYIETFYISSAIQIIPHTYITAQIVREKLTSLAKHDSINNINNIWKSTFTDSNIYMIHIAS